MSQGEATNVGRGAPAPEAPRFPPQAPLAAPFPDLPALAALGARPRWVVYRAVWLPDRGKWTKIPYDPRTDPKDGRKAATNDPSTWGSLAQAVAYARAAGADGVGYVFRAPPPVEDDEFLHSHDPAFRAASRAAPGSTCSTSR